MSEFPTVQKWEERMKSRPATQKGNDIPHPAKIKELLESPEKMDAYAKESRGWILKGMDEDKKKEK